MHHINLIYITLTCFGRSYVSYQLVIRYVIYHAIESIFMHCFRYIYVCVYITVCI